MNYRYLNVQSKSKRCFSYPKIGFTFKFFLDEQSTTNFSL